MLEWHGEQVNKALEMSAYDVVKLAAESSAKEMKQSMPYGGGLVRSRPGDPPNIDTARLYNSITTEATKDVDGAESIVYTNKLLAPHAVHLEFGTVRMAKRPFFARAVTKVMLTFDAIFAKSQLNITKYTAGLTITGTGADE